MFYVPKANFHDWFFGLQLRPKPHCTLLQVVGHRRVIPRPLFALDPIGACGRSPDCQVLPCKPKSWAIEKATHRKHTESQHCIYLWKDISTRLTNNTLTQVLICHGGAPMSSKQFLFVHIWVWLQSQTVLDLSEHLRRMHVIDRAVCFPSTSAAMYKRREHRWVFMPLSLQSHLFQCILLCFFLELSIK